MSDRHYTLPSMSDGTLRQRRNLLIGTLLLLFIEATEASFSGLTLGLGKLTINKPENAQLLLFFGTVYLLIRFIQYVATDETRSVVVAFHLELKERFIGKLYRSDQIYRIKRIDFNPAPGTPIIQYEIYTILNPSKYTSKVGLFEIDATTYPSLANDLRLNNSDGYEISLLRLICEFVRFALIRRYFTDFILPILVFLITAFYIKDTLYCLLKHAVG